MWEYRGNDTSNDYLEHHKYIRRERVGDKWRYWYKETKDKVETTTKRVAGDIGKKIEKGKKFIKDAFKDSSYAITYREPDGTLVYKKHTGNKIWGRDYVMKSRAVGVHGSKVQRESDDVRMRKRAAATRAERQAQRKRTTATNDNYWKRRK